jgi:hypothetical protein
MSIVTAHIVGVSTATIPRPGFGVLFLAGAKKSMLHNVEI